MKRNMTKSGKIAYGAMLVALAMIFSYVESLIPISIGIPGIKLGVANLVTVLGIFFLGPCEVLTVVIMRIFLVGFMFGNGVSIIYSLAGGLLSLTVMLIIKKTDKFSMVSVSVAGGISHNIGQLLAAAIVLKSTAVGVLSATTSCGWHTDRTFDRNCRTKGLSRSRNKRGKFFKHGLARY